MTLSQMTLSEVQMYEASDETLEQSLGAQGGTFSYTYNCVGADTATC